MNPECFHYDRLVKSEDLNHHGTLFAGRSAEWFVEAGFIAAASALTASSIVCLKIHGMTFTSPVPPGAIACFESKIVHTGRTSLVTYICLKLRDREAPVLDGFITFVHVNEEGKPQPHGLSFEPETEEDRRLNQQAKTLR
jgi:acyl-CoA hydrolase